MQKIYFQADFMNNSISVISVTKNNNIGLFKTLKSLNKQPSKPLEIIVFNGDPSDSKISKIIDIFKKKLNIILISERDNGIYDAMNKAKNIANGTLLHYLNAGDEISDDPYKLIKEPCILKTKMIDPDSKANWLDKPKLCGFAYCHQGIIFPKNHTDYELRYKFCADFDVITKTFSWGLKKIKVEENGLVNYYLNGIFSKNTFQVTLEMIKIVWRNFDIFFASFLILILFTKTLIPRKLRRAMIRYL